MEINNLINVFFYFRNIIQAVSDNEIREKLGEEEIIFSYQSMLTMREATLTVLALHITRDVREFGNDIILQSKIGLIISDI
jgi:hypothetical protein